MARYDQTVNIQQQNLSSGAAESLQSQASGLMGLSSKFAQMSQEASAKRKAKIIEEQTQQGQQDFVRGQQPDFKDEDRMIGGTSAKAYNNGLRAAYTASISNDVRADIADIELKNPDDVIAYNTSIAAHRASLVKSVDPVALPEVLARFDQHTVSGAIRVQGRGEVAARAATVETLNNNIKTLGDESARLARLGDTKASRDGLIELQAHLANAVNAETITEIEAKDILQKNQHESMEQESRHQFDNLLKTEGGIDAAFKRLDNIADKPPKTWTPDKWDAYISSQRADIIRARSMRDAAVGEKSKEAITAVKEYEKAVSLGFPVSQEETNRVATVAATDPKLKKQFDIIQNTKDFSLMPASDRRELLAVAQTGKLDDVDQYAAIITAEKSINDSVRKDGYSFAVSQGLIEPIPFDIGNPESFKDKVKQAERMSVHYGIEVSPLSDAEATSLSDNLNDMTTNEKVALAITLSSSPAVWGQISDKNQGAFAMAGATGDINLMSSVFKGQEALQNKLATPVKSSDFITTFNDYTEGVYDAPDQRSVMEATVAHYASTNPDGVWNEDSFEASLAAVTGGIGKVNGYKVELPRGTTETELDDFFDDLQPETIASQGGVQNMTNERAVELIQRGRVRSVGSGAYMVDMGDGQSLWTAEGKPFVIQWSEELNAANKAAQYAAGRARRSGQGGR